MNKSMSLQRRGPDNITLEIANVLSSTDWFEFKPLFLVVHANLRARKAAHGGEEILRLRAYEKLQTLVQVGRVEKNGKSYRGVPGRVIEVKEHEAAVHCSELLTAVKGSAPVVLS